MKPQWRSATRSKGDRALDFMYYNVGRVHQPLRVTPAMEAGSAEYVGRLEKLSVLTEGEHNG